MNEFVDSVLRVIYDCALDRGIEAHSIIFSSWNPIACTTVSLKQPNFAVFFSCACGEEVDSHVALETLPTTTNAASCKNPSINYSIKTSRIQSIQGAVNFASRSNLMGLMLPARPLVLFFVVCVDRGSCICQ